jgi:hypothetical protein
VISKPIKNDVSNYDINLKKTIQQSPITILPMFLAGESPIRLGLFSAGFEGFYGFGLWEVKMLWVQLMGVTLVQGPAHDWYILISYDR